MKAIKKRLKFAGKEYDIEWIAGDSYEGLQPLKQAYGFCFNKDGQLLVQQKEPGSWQVMGGTIEVGETPEQALMREVDEEVNIEIDNIKYLGAQKVIDSNGYIHYQLRFGAKITKMKDRLPDPANGIVRKIKFINPDCYAEVSGWGDIGTAIVKQALKKLDL